MKQTYALYHIKDKSKTKNNIYIIADHETKKAAVIDPATGFDEINELVKRFDLTLDAILITHVHRDHIGSVGDLIKRHNCNVYVSEKEASYYKYHCKNMHLFEDQELIHLGDTAIKCLLTPGHTAGSTCFLLKNTLFSGDTIFMEGCSICTSDGASAVDMFHSIEKIKRQVADSVLVYSGHTLGLGAEPGQSIAYLKKHNIYFNIDDEEFFVDFRMRKGQENLYDFR